MAVGCHELTLFDLPNLVYSLRVQWSTGRFSVGAMTYSHNMGTILFEAKKERTWRRPKMAGSEEQGTRLSSIGDVI